MTIEKKNADLGCSCVAGGSKGASKCICGPFCNCDPCECSTDCNCAKK